MTQELMFKDGTTLEILNESSLVPSGSIYVRNKIDIYVADGDLMGFLAKFSNEENLSEMLFTGYDELGEIIYQYHLYNYKIVSEIGKKLIETANSETGEVSAVTRLIAVLEQPTAAEGGGSEEAEEIMNILLGGAE